jgi:chaperone BCS1
VSLTVHSEDALHLHISNWLYSNGFDTFARDYRIRFIDGEATYGPGVGEFKFFYRNNLISANVRQEAAQQGSGTWHGHRSQTREFLTISYLSFTRSRTLLEQVIVDAVTAARAIKEKGVAVYAYNGGWDEVARVKKTKHPTVILAAGQLEALEHDVKTFTEREEWYDVRGVPYRRGYLLTGPPGTGKTSVVKYLAQKFGMPIYVCDGTMSSIKSVPANGIMLLEDVDSIATMNRNAKQMRRDDDDDDSPRAVKSASSEPTTLSSLYAPNLSELLNALDGVTSVEGVLVFMTTNHPEKLDHALIRPGRVDFRTELSYCTAEQAARLFRKFFQANDDVVKLFERQFTAGHRYTPAQLQKIFLEAPDEAYVIEALAEPEEATA